MSDDMEAVLIQPSSWTLLPPADPDSCQECGRRHPPEDPHDAQALHYQYSFYLAEAKAGREERWPTWADAMAHCTPEVQAQWKAALAERGVPPEQLE